MKKLLIPTALLFCVFFISCTESDDGINFNQSPQISSYKKNTTSTADGSSFERTVAGSLINNKFQGFSYEKIVDGEVTDFQEVDNFQYVGNLLIQIISEDLDNDIVTNLFYDSDGKLIGAKLSSENGSQKHYRIVEASENTYYLEVITMPHTDPNAEIQNRYIVELDDEDNILKAGRDQNLDGIFEFEKLFTYTNNNLTSIEIDGNVQKVSYSPIRNTRGYILKQAYGKKVSSIINAEIINWTTNVNRITQHIKSEHLTIDQANEATYEVAANGFYTKKESIQNNSIETEEFFFE